MPLEWIFALAGAVALAAATGLRAFLPLLGLGIAARTGWIDLQPGAEWMARDTALVCFGLAAAIEIAADKIPVVDHALDVVGTFVRPVAGAFAAWAMLPAGPGPWPEIGAIVLGGGTLAMHALKAKLRLGSTAVTLGHGNPIVSGIEDFLTILLVIVGIVIPLVAIALVFVVVSALARKRRAALPPPAPSLSSPRWTIASARPSRRSSRCAGGSAGRTAARGTASRRSNR